MRMFVWLLCVGLSPALCQAEDWNCLQEPDSLYAHLQQEAYLILDQRLEAFETLKTTEQIHAHQAKLREMMIERIGTFPEKTPLNSQVVRTIQAEGYRIENVIFESRPQHHVTANFYIPDGAGPFPAILVASGHSRTAKTADYNQRYGIIMAQNGMAALCFDPIGQGERSQILNDAHQNQFPGTTTEHFLVGVGSILVGRNTAHYETWDAIRCIDYLLSRPEVLPDRIGMTGCSGGGTQTSYAMAIDDRIRCAAPSCYLTTFRHLIETIGPQDAEQNIFGQLKFGLDQPDYVIMRAPLPTLISSTTEDFFSIEGSWENLRQAKRIYSRLGFPEQVDLVESDGKHGVPPQNLASIAQWMQRWLLDRDQNLPAREISDRPAEDLLCTDSGQVLNLPAEQSVMQLNAALEKELAKSREQIWQTTSPADLRKRIQETIGMPADKPGVKLSARKVGEAKRDSYTIEKVVLEQPAGVPMPALIFRPAKFQGTISLILNTNGKAIETQPESTAATLAQAGNLVIAVDLPGQGETAYEKRTDLHGDWKTFYLAYLIEKSLIGIWTEQTLAIADFARTIRPEEAVSLQLTGKGEAGIVALHAVALQPEQFESVVLHGTPDSWSAVVSQPVPQIGVDYTVHGALELYDLPHLRQLAGENRVTLSAE